MTKFNHEGGAGSVLAVTTQNFGRDKLPFTSDDISAPLNDKPTWSSVDSAGAEYCTDASDRIRGFYSFHNGGAYFVYGDGSVHFIDQTIDNRAYVALSTIATGDIVTE